MNASFSATDTDCVKIPNRSGRSSSTLFCQEVNMLETQDAVQPLHSSKLSQVWPQIMLDRSKRGGLVDQIVNGVQDLMQCRELRVGTKMPSVRQFAKSNAISTFTVVEAYDRLVTLGLLSSKRGSGYYVARQDVLKNHAHAAYSPPSSIDSLTTDLYSGVTDALPAGSGWLPPEWYGESTLLDAVRQAMRIPSNRLRGYGNPLGFPALRQYLAKTLSEGLFPVEAEQIMLTHGATHAFDLILRTLTKPGDCVFVEEPGYSNLIALIRHHGCIPVAIPRNAAGLDFDILQARASTLQAKLMFVNTALQNPLGTSLSHVQAHRLLTVAEQFDFWLVEDDIYRELAPRSDPSLAAMDGLRRVIRVGSFSKTLSPALRVGSITASASLIPELLRVKMLVGLTTSEINERAVYHAVTARAYPRMLTRLITQLESARERSIHALNAAGLELLAQPRGGMFLAAGWKVAPDSELNGKVIADQALKAGILLSPDDFFCINPSNSIWFRFNVAYAEAPELASFLAGFSRRLQISNQGAA
jgi:DNA-binding transcriptional MocR family regulator